MARNATTIILLTRNELVRADFARSGRRGLTELSRQPRPDLPDLASIVECALLQSPGVGRRVWLLSTDLWTQTLTLPRLKMSGLSPQQLVGALNFEAEGVSGQSAHESALAYTTQPAGHQETGYWVVQAPSSPLPQLEESIRRAGGQLAGIAHPAGLPQPLRAKAPREWQRVELWPDAVVCLAGRGDGDPEVHVFNFDPQAGRWQGQVDQWRKTHGTPDHFEMLVSADVSITESVDDAAVIRLTDDDSLKRWLESWAGWLAESRVPVPLLRPPQRPMSVARRRNLAAILTLLAAAGCAFHYHVCLPEWRTGLLKELQVHQAPAKSLAEAQKQAKDAEARQKELQQQLERAHRESLLLAVHRRRYARFLEVLGQQGTDDLIVQKIDAKAGELTVHGTSLNTHLADRLAGALAREAPELHWEVLPSNKKALEKLPDGGPWSFALTLKDLPLDLGTTTTGAKPPPSRR
jgi:hypothetical protein